MIFTIIVSALIVAIVMFHYVQGMFSAMVSATLVILAAMLAISYHEPLAEAFILKQFPNQAHAMALVGLFALIYFVLRLITDKIVPGNVRVPVTVDKIGAGIFGLIAAIFTTGVFAIAAQMLPFGTSIGAFARFETADRDIGGVRIAGKSQMQDLKIYDELKTETLDDEHATGVPAFLPVDNMTMALATYVSDGSLAGDMPLASVHPSYLNELFGQRVGPANDQHVLYSSDKAPALKVPLVYLRQDTALKKVRADKEPRVDFKKPDMVAVAVRVRVDSESKVSPANLQLIVKGRAYYPVGVAQSSASLLTTRLDDPLVIPAGKMADFVFLVDKSVLEAADGSGAMAKKMPAGAFIQFKRTARVSLADKELGTDAGSSTDVGIQEKDAAQQK